MISHNEWLIVGLITSPHGIKGEVKVKSYSDFEERFTKPGKRWIQKEKETPKELELISGFQQPGRQVFIVSFKNFSNRNLAESVKGFKLLVKVNDIPKLNNEEYHLTELVNLEVKLWEGNQLQTIGEVINLENEKTQLLLIKLFKNNKEIFVPFVKEIIPEVNIKNKYLIITPPPGLLEL